MNVGTGHWIFAAIFTVSFIVILFFLYQADGKMYGKVQYKNVKSIVWIIVAALFLMVLVKIAARMIGSA